MWTSHDSLDQVSLSEGEIYFLVPWYRHLKSKLWDLCGLTDVEKLKNLGNGNIVLRFSNGDVVERSGRELERVFGNHIVQFFVEGGKPIEKALIIIIGLSESINN